MSIQFSPVGPRPTDYCFCSEPLADDIVAHDGLHHVHKKCLETWAKTSPTCPTCRQEFDASSMLSLRERTVLWLKQNCLNEEVLLSVFSDGYCFPASLGGINMALVMTGFPEITASTVALIVLAGSVLSVAGTRMLSPTYRNHIGLRMFSTMTIAYLSSLAITLALQPD